MRPEETESNKTLGSEVAIKEKRKAEAKQNTGKSVWAGLGLFGMVGWSVTVPTLLGTALGIWFDKKWPEHFSWTLTMLVTGLALGCRIAWVWVEKENKNMHTHKNDENE